MALRSRRGLLKPGGSRFFLEVPVTATQRLTEKVGKLAAKSPHVIVIEGKVQLPSRAVTILKPESKPCQKRHAGASGDLVNGSNGPSIAMSNGVAELT